MGILRDWGGIISATMSKKNTRPSRTVTLSVTFSPESGGSINAINADSWKKHPRFLFTKQVDVLPQDLVKSQSRAIRVETFPIALKFDRHLGSNATEMPVKFQSDTVIVISNLGASRHHEILR